MSFGKWIFKLVGIVRDLSDKLQSVPSLVDEVTISMRVFLISFWENASLQSTDKEYKPQVSKARNYEIPQEKKGHRGRRNK